MKKKGVNLLAIIGIALVAVILGVVLLFVLRAPKNDTPPPSSGGMGSIDLGASALKLETIDQFQAFAESGNYECSVGADKSGGSISKVPLLGQETIVTYYFDKQGNTTDFEAFYFLNANINDQNMEIQEMTTEQLAEAAWDTLETFCLMFSCDVISEVYLENADGSFTLIEDDGDFQSVAEGTAWMTFSIRDQEGYFWELTISTAEELVSANVKKYFNVEESMNYVANISLYEGE